MPLELSLLGTVALCALLYLIVRWKDRKMREVQLTGPFRILSPVLNIGSVPSECPRRESPVGCSRKSSRQARQR